MDNRELISLGIKLVNDHIMIDDEQGLVIDTGSPHSFHESGLIKLGGKSIDVANSLPGVLCDYLSKKIGVRVQGIMGVDIIHQYRTLISLKDSLMFINDDDSSLWQLQSIPLPMNLFGIKIQINGQQARMVVDTAAPVSYINRRYVYGQRSVDTVNDFSPYCGDFEAEIYEGETSMGLSLGDFIYTQRYGIPPPIVSLMLDSLSVDGIIGVDLFKRYRLQLFNGHVFLPPQGI